MSLVKSGIEYRWLRSIHRYWILPLELISTLLLVAAVMSAICLPLLGLDRLVLAVVGVLLAASITLLTVYHFLFYRAIRCSDCGYNPTRYKNGKNLPKNTAWKRLSGLERCPACAGDPDSSEAAGVTKEQKHKRSRRPRAR